LYFDFFVNTKHCFIELEIKHYLLIFTWRRPGASSVSSSSKWVSPKKVFEDVIKVEIKWVASHPPAPETIMTKLVISASSFFVRQDRVRLTDFFEFRFCFFVVGVRVGVIFACKLAVRAFELVGRCAAIDS
jgi:hypothetical protein|tara:strand:- start:329 stop:721 length:393 start_codon:yes stop_codon:yes gene_type:complete